MKCKFILILSIISLGLFGQENSFRWPLDMPVTITGNYGELRPNHFHAGLDFSTKGTINLPVYAVENGYVLRIKISATGYGKSVYITHSNGKVSLYGHLNSLSPILTEIVKKEQYLKQNYEVELFPNDKNLTFRKGEVVGWSGNSGNSTGPHLHFELRDELTEVPLNPFQFFKVSDAVSPTLKYIGFFNLADTSAPKFLSSYLIKSSSNNILIDKPFILKNSILGLAFSGFDKLTANGNANNIYGSKLFLDGVLIYSHQLNAISFSDARFVNEFSETIEKTKHEKIKLQKCFLPTLYPQGLYQDCINKGRIILTDTAIHQLKLIVYDEHNNQTSLKFSVKANNIYNYTKSLIKSDLFVDCTKDFMVSKNKLQIFIPANNLYYSTNLIFENTIESTGKLIILPSEAKLKSTSIIGFQVPKKLLKNKSKLVLKNEHSTFIPINKNDSVFYSVKNFGWFQLELDTIAPNLKMKLTSKQIAKTKKWTAFSFLISDKLSGIGKYNLYINGKWALAEYDAKNHLLTYYFDNNTPNGDIQFKLEVEDKVANKNTLEFLLKRI